MPLEPLLPYLLLFFFENSKEICRLRPPPTSSHHWTHQALLTPPREGNYHWLVWIHSWVSFRLQPFRKDRIHLASDHDHDVIRKSKYLISLLVQVTLFHSYSGVRLIGLYDLGCSGSLFPVLGI
jgi:hypothetical protein